MVSGKRNKIIRKVVGKKGKQKKVSSQWGARGKRKRGKGQDGLKNLLGG